MAGKFTASMRRSSVTARIAIRAELLEGAQRLVHNAAESADGRGVSRVSEAPEEGVPLLTPSIRRGRATTTDRAAQSADH